MVKDIEGGFGLRSDGQAVEITSFVRIEWLACCGQSTVSEYAVDIVLIRFALDI